MQRITVVGGGIIGLACAWRLALAGARVVLLDAATGAREASWAAAGMLAPHHERLLGMMRPESWRLGCHSLALWPDFAAGLGGAEVVDLDCSGGLLPLLPDEPSDDAALTLLTAEGVAVERLDGHAVRRIEPALTGDLAGAWLLPGGRVDPRRTLLALQGACSAAGVDLRYACPVTGLDGSRLRMGGGSWLEADAILLASGAWTPALAGLAGRDLAGDPVKGQMLRLQAPDGICRCFLHHTTAYVVPRRGVGMVVGATMAETGFDRSQDDDAIGRLAAGARRLLPDLAHAPVLEAWTGLRPRLRSGLPCIGWLRPGLLVATGHFRNGILLAPATAELVVQLLLGLPRGLDAKPFAPS